MKIVDNKVSELSKTLSESTLIEAFDSNIFLASELVDLHKILLTTKEVEEQGLDPEEVEARQLYHLEEIYSFGGLRSIEFVSKCRIYETSSLNDRIELVSLNLKPLFDAVEILTLAGVGLSDASVINLRETVGDILNNYIYCLYLGSGFAEIKEKMEENEDFEIQSYVIKTIESKGFKLDIIVNYFAELFKEYRPNLTVFEKAPELETQFYVMAGIYIDQFISHEDLLDLDLVLEVVTGDKPIEEIVYEFKNKVKKITKSKA